MIIAVERRGEPMDREDFMDIVYSELESDPDNNRANRIIWAADGYAERRVNDALQTIEELQHAQLGTNLAEVGTDLISRRRAIDAVTDELDIIDHVPQWVFDRLEKRLKQLPPAQTEQHHDEWCTDCKEYDKERHCCPRWNKVIRQALADAQPEPCEDAVSRKAVKDGFVEMCNLICPYTEKQRHVMCGSCLLGTAFDVLEATQSVTPKQRTGKWIYQMGMIKCNQCLRAIRRIDHDGLLNFCPNCGADMTEGDME